MHMGLPFEVTLCSKVIFGTKEFTAGSGAGGGDFNTPGSTEYQQLHSDGGGGDKGPDTYPDVKFEYRNDGSRHLVDLEAEEDPEKRYQVVNMRDVPLRESSVTANYPMEICFDSDVGHTPFNGATRQIPNTQSLDSRNGNPIPKEDEEPLWMKMSVTQPCPAGSVMLRDSRAWHGTLPTHAAMLLVLALTALGLPRVSTLTSAADITFPCVLRRRYPKPEPVHSSHSGGGLLPAAGEPDAQSQPAVRVVETHDADGPAHLPLHRMRSRRDHPAQQLGAALAQHGDQGRPEQRARGKQGRQSLCNGKNVKSNAKVSCTNRSFACSLSVAVVAGERYMYMYRVGDVCRRSLASPRGLLAAPKVASLAPSPPV